MVILNKKENSMQDFVYNSNVKIIYGENQLPLVIKEMKKIGNKLLIVSTNSFISGGHLEILENELKKEEYKSNSKHKKQMDAEQKFRLKQQKKKAKHRGH